jgi:hypothetical protein
VPATDGAASLSKQLSCRRGAWPPSRHRLGLPSDYPHPSVQVQHDVAYSSHGRRSSGAECALLIQINRPGSCHEHLRTHYPVHTPSVSGRDHQPWRVALLPLCATRRNDVMRGNFHGLYRQAMSRWAVAPGGCTPGVKELALKGTGAARGKPPRSRAWLRTHRVSQRSDQRPTGNRAPASRPCLMGQRPHPMGITPPTGDRGW